jgi:allantoate deiminase
VRETLAAIAARRGVSVEAETYQTNKATPLASLVIDAVAEAIAACGQQVLRLPSGAGHDAGVMAKICPAGMMFVRCKDGISHNPAEAISAADAALALKALLEATRRLDRRLASPGASFPA